MVTLGDVIDPTKIIEKPTNVIVLEDRTIAFISTKEAKNLEN